MSGNKVIRNLWLPYFATDLFAIAAACGVALYVRLYSKWGMELFGELNRLLGIQEPADLGYAFRDFYAGSWFRLVLIICTIVCTIYAFMNLYSGRRFVLKRPVAWNIFVANAIALGLFFCYFYARMNVFHPRTMFVTIMALNVVFAVTFRAIMYSILQHLRARGFDECRAVLVGSGREADAMEDYLNAVSPHGIRIVERIPAGPATAVPALAESIRIAVAAKSAGMVICADSSLELQQIMSVVELSGQLGVSAKALSHRLEVIVTQAKLATDMIHGVPLVHFDAPAETILKSGMRRVGSVASAIAAMIILSPLFLVLALVIKLTSKGPAFYIQERIGLARNPFRMFKFRTMHHLADEAQSELEDNNETGGVIFKVRNDPRVTLIGRFLRRFSLDELPQLANVLGGAMALIGPRPLPRRDYEKYGEEWQYHRHTRLPGMTGLWQVSGRSDVDFNGMCILDIYYIHNESPVLDARILLKTIWVVLFAKGAY